MKKFIVVAAISLAAIASSGVNAAMLVYNAPLANPFTFSADKGILTFSYSGPTVSQIAAGDDNTGATPTFGNQNPATIADAIETVFSLPANTFGPVGSNGNISGNDQTITSTTAYDYLAVHFGGYEVFFHFAALVPANTPFRIFDVSTTKPDGSNGGGGGLSNYRAYNSVSEVPIPAAAFMLAPALLGFLGFRRRNTKV